MPSVTGSLPAARAAALAAGVGLAVGARAAPAQPHVVRGDGARQTVACAGRPLVVRGHRNELVLRGACPRVVVVGDDNVLALDSAGTIATRGRGNRVTYLAGIAGRVPGVTDTGAGNTVGPRR